MASVALIAERGAPGGGELLNLRYILFTIIEEYARHSGHADLVRESVDGPVGQDSPA